MSIAGYTQSDSFLRFFRGIQANSEQRYKITTPLGFLNKVKFVASWIGKDSFEAEGDFIF